MIFSDSYFEDEIKAGFYVEAKMKGCWAAQLEVLNEIDRICRKYNIQYFAEWGTLLGTIRHGGFIPWDDDMDIAMKRMDYERFLKVAPRELPTSYQILNYRNQEDYWDVMARVLNAEFFDTTPEFLDQYHNCPYACGVDIFPLDYVTRNKEEEKIQRDLIEMVKTVADTYGHGGIAEEDLEDWLVHIEIICRQKIDREGDIRLQLYKIVCGLYALYGEEESDYIALMPRYLDEGGHIYPKECYADSIRMPFENVTIPVPVGYDHILKLKYGDYMKSVRKGGSHDYPYYEKQDKFLEDKGVVLPKYEYPGKLDQRVKNPAFRQTLNEKLDLLAQIQEKLELLIRYQEQETTLKLLQEIQNVAIGIGESIEKKVGEGTETVSCLEQYCEVAYQLYETIVQHGMPDGAEVRAILDQVLQIVRTAADAMPIRKEVVFMPYRANQWKAIESVWKAANEDEDCDVKVVPIPYYYKRRLGEVLSEMRYDGKSFPDYVPIIPFHQYFMKNNHPDVIYIQNPYDEWNHTLTVHKDYYSTELWKNTEELIYIPWFKIDEMDPEDERGLKSRKHFVPMPGVVNADKVIVQSEGMKQSYVDYLCEWAGEDTRSIWEEKILGLGSPLDDAAPDMVELPVEWKEKKLLLYHISGNGLLEHGEKMIQKIQKSMQIFVQQADKMQIIWLQDVQMRQRLEPRIPEVFRQYVELLEKYRQEAWVTPMAAEQEAEAVQMADAFYGDAGKCAQLMKQASKPVMLQNVEI